MRNGLRRLAAMTCVVAGGLVSAACYFTTDFDSLSGGSAAPVAEGGGADTALANAGDGAQAADASDARPIGDADVADVAGFVCPTGAFCDDFERATVQGAWDTVGQNGANTIDITGHARTGASGLRSTVGQTQAAGGASLFRNVGVVKTLTYDFWLFDNTPANRSVNLAGFTIYSNAGTHSIAAFFLLAADGTIALLEQEYDNGTQTYFNVKGTTPVVLNRWVECHMEVDVSGTSAVAHVTYGSQTLFSGALARPYAAAAAQVSVGVPYATSGSAIQIDYDDVALSVTGP